MYPAVMGAVLPQREYGPSGRRRASRWPGSKAPSRARARNRPCPGGQDVFPAGTQIRTAPAKPAPSGHGDTGHACAERHSRCPRSGKRSLPARGERSERPVAGPARRRTLTSPGDPARTAIRVASPGAARCASPLSVATSHKSRPLAICTHNPEVAGSCKELRCLISAGVPGLHEHPRLVR